MSLLLTRTLFRKLRAEYVAERMYAAQCLACNAVRVSREPYPQPRCTCLGGRSERGQAQVWRPR